MNNIFAANMQAIMRADKHLPKPKRAVRLHEGSKAKEIIVYLLKNGKTSGADLMVALKLKNSPKAYIQPHVVTARVICERVNIHCTNYSIHPSLKKSDFGMKP